MAKRITEFTSATSLAETDVLPVVDVSDTTQATSGTTKKSALSLIADYIKTRVETLTNKTLSTGSVIDANVTVVEVLKKVYPVGSLYINASVATNPATLLGFGTWEAFGQGRVMVGKATSGTFATAGATGGAETHTLQVTEIPAHNHNISILNGATDDYLAGSSADYGMDVNFNSAHTQRELTEIVGGGLAHNNLQPYIVVYMWKRAS
jgi:hypothetical protein